MEINRSVEVKYNPVMDKDQFDKMRDLCVKIKYQALNEPDQRICAEIDNMRKLFSYAIKEAFYKGIQTEKDESSSRR